MKNKSVLLFKCAVFAVLLIGSSSFNAVFAAPFDVFSENPFSINPNLNLENQETEIFSLVNSERARKNLPPVEWDGELAKLARNYSKQMARERFFDHFDRSGTSVVERAENARIGKWSKIGENLFLCEGIDRFSFTAVKGWMKSPTHRKNILDRSWTDSGIGIARSRSGQIYVTQVFIKR
jgi:uncharacterized protein YkwD